MRQAKVYSILQGFSKIEQNRCRKYIYSPYFNQNQPLCNLFDLIIDQINSGDGKDWSREDVWKAIVEDEDLSYDDTRMRKYFSDLLKLVEGFLSQEVFQEDPLNEAIYLISAIGRRKLEKLYNSASKKARQLSEKAPFRSTNHYLNQYLIERNYYEMSEFEEKRTVKSNLEEISQNLDRFYIAGKLQIYLNALARKNLANYEYDLHFIDDIIRFIQENDFQDVPPIAIYFQIYQLYNHPEDESQYFKLKKQLDNYAQLFPKEEANDFYSHAQNYCVRKLNQGDVKFLKELFLLYQDMLPRGLFLSEGEFSPWTFRNIIIVALRLGEYDWTRQFIEEYSPFLPEDQRENAVSFNLSQLYFYQKKYDQVIRLLQTVEYDDLTYNLNSKTILLHTYYETDEIEPLLSLLESFRVFLNRRQGIPEDRKLYFKNLIKFTKRLSRVLPKDSKGIQKLKKEVEETPNIASRKWLLEKISELE